MQMTIHGQPIQLVDIKQFRKEHQLPDDFGIRLFEDKDFDGLGRIDTGGSELIALRHTVMEAIPKTIQLPEILSVVSNISVVFRVKMYEINPTIGLRPVEIDFAAAGFEDVCQAYAYALIRHKTQNTELDFNAIYGEWLNGSIRVSSTAHPYVLENREWEVFIINNAYGRIGLQVNTGSSTIYVRDSAFTCPAEGFMFILLKDVTAAFLNNIE